MSIHKISCHIAQILSRELALGEDDSEVMAYGLEIILSSVTKLVVILSSAYFLDIFSTTMVALLTFSSFRLLSGGVHFSDYYRCLGFGLLIMLSLGKLAQIFILSQTFHLLVFTFVIGLSAFFLCLKWAPAENPNKILTDEEKEKFRVLSVIFTVVWMGIIHVFVVYSQGRFNSLVMASAMGIWVQSLTLTPQGGC